MAESEEGAQLRAGAAAAHPYYVQQRHSWDCGLACAQMVLRRLGLWRAGFTERTLCALVESPSRSVWTVDIALMLQALGVEALVLHTLLAGVDPAHAARAYYASALTGPASEAPRIAAAFAAARQRGIAVRVPSALPSAYLLQRLRQQTHCFVVLVDMRLLRCEACGPEHSARELAGLSRPQEYNGHYVLLTGVEEGAAGGGCVVRYLDPSPLGAAAGCSMSAACLDAARQAPGTDEDVIEIALPGAAGEAPGGGAGVASPPPAGEGLN